MTHRYQCASSFVHKNRSGIASVVAAALIAAAPIYSSTAQAEISQQASAIHFDIAAGDLESALLRFGSQANVQVAIEADLARGITTNGVSGDFQLRDGLDQLLKGTGLAYQMRDGNSITIVRGGTTPLLVSTGSAGIVADPPASATAGELEEIVVSAQKRTERLQDVPLSVSVLSASALDDNRIGGLEQLQQVSPSISFTNSANTRGQGVAIRGIGTLNFSDGVEPSVSTVVDGVVIGRSAATFFDFNDIERIEVLRGPQGTLFGKNSSAGVLNIVTARPDLDDFKLNAAVSRASYNDTRVKLSTSAPLSAGLAALGLSAFYTEADGIINNAYDGRNLNNNKSYGARGKLLYLPFDPFCRRLGTGGQLGRRAPAFTTALLLARIISLPTLMAPISTTRTAWAVRLRSMRNWARILSRPFPLTARSAYTTTTTRTACPSMSLTSITRDKSSVSSPRNCA